MASQLEDLLKSIDPDRVFDEVARRADEAIASLPSRAVQIEEWEEFRLWMTQLVRHIEAKVLCLREPVPASPEFLWDRCIPILQEAFGPSGMQTAFEIIRTAVEGGTYRVAKDVARTMAAAYVHNELTARITAYWNSLSVKEKFAAQDEYLERYGHLLPSELTEGSAGRLRAHFQKVLEHHARLMQELGRLGRTC